MTGGAHGIGQGPHDVGLSAGDFPDTRVEPSAVWLGENHRSRHDQPYRM